MTSHKVLFTMMKLKTLNFTLLLSTIFASHTCFAQNFDETRAIALTNATIQLFANSHLSSPDNQIKVLALMDGIPETETRKNYQQVIQDYQSPSENMFNVLKAQFGEQDFKIVKPALEHQLVTQNAFYKSCKISGKVTEDFDDLVIPLDCQIPQINLSKITPPQRQLTDSEAQFMAQSIYTIANSLEQAPKQAYTTQMLIHRDGQRYIPDLDNSNYFPSSISQHIIGPTEKPTEDAPAWLNEEDAAP